MFTIIILLAHTLVDFLIQTDNVVKMKKEMNPKGYFYHGLTLMITMLPILLLIKYNLIFIVFVKILIIVVTHVVVDIIKEMIHKKHRNNTAFAAKNAILFISDQLVHIMLIIIITKDTTLDFNNVNEFVARVFLSGNVITYSYLVKVFIVIYISFSGAYFIPSILEIIYRGVEDYANKLDEILEKDLNQEAKIFDNKVKTGKWIGIFERFLILIFLCINQFSLIGFIIAIKSLCRFKLMENKVFSEYYLIGTMASLSYTFVLYSILNKILA